MRAPWSDLKVAFAIVNPERFMRKLDSGTMKLPDGWECCETDCAGARCVIVFRVAGVPATEDGRVVAQLIRRWGR